VSQPRLFAPCVYPTRLRQLPSHALIAFGDGVEVACALWRTCPMCHQQVVFRASSVGGEAAAARNTCTCVLTRPGSYSFHSEVFTFLRGKVTVVEAAAVAAAMIDTREAAYAGMDHSSSAEAASEPPASLQHAAEQGNESMDVAAGTTSACATAHASQDAQPERQLDSEEQPDTELKPQSLDAVGAAAAHPPTAVQQVAAQPTAAKAEPVLPASNAPLLAPALHPHSAPLSVGNAGRKGALGALGGGGGGGGGALPRSPRSGRGSGRGGRGTGTHSPSGVPRASEPDEINANTPTAIAAALQAVLAVQNSPHARRGTHSPSKGSIRVQGLLLATQAPSPGNKANMA
jgi:hypothetical protein